VDGALLMELFTREGSGSMLTADKLERLRPASIDDAGGILRLIEPLEADGTLVFRGRELLEREIQRFFVLEHDGMIVGCAALYRSHPERQPSSPRWRCFRVALSGAERSWWAPVGTGETARLSQAVRAHARHPLVHQDLPRVPCLRFPKQGARSTTGSGAPRCSSRRSDRG
jgi:hypothetical protein